jgi:hypothetical protein
MATERSGVRRPPLDRCVVRQGRQCPTATRSRHCRRRLTDRKRGADIVHQHGPFQPVVGDVRVARRGRPPVSSGRSIVPARPLTPCRSADRAANDSFDASLKTRNPLWGLRDLETVIVAAGGSTLARVVQMPANNPWVVLQRNSLQTWPMAVRGTAATHDLLSPTTHKQTLQGLPPPSCGHSFNEVSG